MSKGELETGDQELLDVGAADVLALLDLDNTEDLHGGVKDERNDLGKMHVRGST